MRANTRVSKNGRGPSLEKTAQTRDALLSAALEEFLEHGYSGARVAKVAQRCGLAHGTIYRYFETKEQLFEGVVKQIISGLVNIGVTDPARPGERIGDYFRRTLIPRMQVAEASGRADLARLVLAEGRRFPHVAEVYRREVFEPMNAHIRHFAAVALQSGELRNDSLVRHPELLLAPLWMGTLTAGVLRAPASLEGPDCSTAVQLFSAQIDLFFRK